MTQGAFLQGSQHAPEVPSALPGHCRHGTAGLTNEAVMILIYIYIYIHTHIYIYMYIYIYNGYYNPLINKLMRISQYNNSTWLGSSLVKHCNSGNHGIFLSFAGTWRLQGLQGQRQELRSPWPQTLGCDECLNGEWVRSAHQLIHKLLLSFSIQPSMFGVIVNPQDGLKVNGGKICRKAYFWMVKHCKAL